MSHYLKKIIALSLAGSAYFLVNQSNAQEPYDYQTGQAASASAQQTYYDDKNYQSTTPTKKHFYSGNWSLTLGASVYTAPKYEGDKNYDINVDPMISIGKAGRVERFTSRNDNISFSLLDRQLIRMGLVGKILTGRDSDTSGDLKGLKRVKWGGEAGGFAELYPTDWLRLRGELRQGFRSHDGVTADLAVDAYTNITDTVRLSGGPRAFYATKDYFKNYYGVNAKESLRSGLREYHADDGWGSVGLGGAVTWKTTPKVTTSLFGEYKRLVDVAGDSSLVDQRGDKNQFTVGVSATYRFDFSIR